MIWENEISRFTFTTLEDIALAKYEGDLDMEALAKAAHNENSRGRTARRLRKDSNGRPPRCEVG
jgi:hypothetical protein